MTEAREESIISCSHFQLRKGIIKLTHLQGPPSEVGRHLPLIESILGVAAFKDNSSYFYYFLQIFFFATFPYEN